MFTHCVQCSVPGRYQFPKLSLMILTSILSRFPTLMLLRSMWTSLPHVVVMMLSGATILLHACSGRCCNSLMIQQTSCWLPVGQHCWQRFCLPNLSCTSLLWLVWVKTIVMSWYTNVTRHSHLLLQHNLHYLTRPDSFETILLPQASTLSVCQSSCWSLQAAIKF